MATQQMVLVVDGDTRDRTSTVLLLEAAGYQVRSARNFEDARAMLIAERPDLLITDLRLGPYNGLHLVLWGRTEHPEMASLVTSRVADPVLEAEARRQSAQFLLRPIADPQLLDAITSLLGRPAEPITKSVAAGDLC